MPDPQIILGLSLVTLNYGLICTWARHGKRKSYIYVWLRKASGRRSIRRTIL